ncbi:MAG: SDR family NAD(P)-dependent oxidoreductase [Bryobacteraceae bacterium]
MFNVRGKVALITGGGSGLGRAITLGYAHEGMRVLVTDIDGQAARATLAMVEREGGHGLAAELDVTSRSSIENFVRTAVISDGTIDVLVNSAGLAIRGAALEYTDFDWDKIIAVNLTGTFLCSQIVGRLMASKGAGKIINLASIGAFIAYPGSIAYLASKGGVVQLTKGFAVELAASNVQVNAIAPSLFDTPMVRASRSDEQSLRYFTERTPTGRLGSPEEIVGAAIFLASDATSMITGHTLAVDGGFLSA